MRLFVLSIIGLVLFGFLARPLILDQVPIEYDLGRYHLPLRDFYQRCLHNGDDPAWCPQLLCGYDLHGEGQAGMDHPWHRLLYSFMPLTVAFNIEVIANYPFMCLGTYLFLRRHRLPQDAALAGALTATFGGFTLPHYSHTNAIAIVAHMPWLLWATDSLWTDTRPRRQALAGLAIAMLTGSQILLGYPQYVYFSCLAESVYVALLFVRDWSWRRLVIWLTFKVLGIAIGGAQLLPSLQALSLSPRLGYDAGFRGMLSLPPEMLLQLVSPTTFNVGTQLHEYTVYGGALATLGTAWFIIRGSWFGGRDLLNRFTFWLIIIAVPLALGRYTPLFQFYLKLPIVGVFRCPCRYLVLSHFAAAIVVARFVQGLGGAERSSESRLYWLLIVPCLAWLTAFMPWNQVVTQDCQKFLAPAGAGWFGAIVITAATLLVIAARRRATWVVPLLLIVCFADLGYWGFRSIYGTSDTPVHTYVDLATFQRSQLTPPGTPPGRVHIADIHGNGAMMLGWSLTSGYVGLSPPRSLDYGTEVTQRLAATSWRYDNNHWKRIDGLPRIRWKIDGVAVENINVLTDRSGHVEISTNAPQPRSLVFAESHHPSWRATIDGQPTEIVVAHSDFQSVNVPAGEHRVVFQFDPVHRTCGRRFSFTGLTLAIVIAAWMMRRSRSTMTESLK
jgi:hypothetical protein